MSPGSFRDALPHSASLHAGNSACRPESYRRNRISVRAAVWRRTADLDTVFTISGAIISRDRNPVLNRGGPGYGLATLAAAGNNDVARRAVRYQFVAPACRCLDPGRSAAANRV